MPWHIVIAVTALAALAGSLRADGESSQLQHHGSDLDMDPSVEILPPSAGLRGPYFEPTASKNVTALVGKTAYLNCRVRNLGNRTEEN